MGTKILSSVFTALLLFQLTACGNTSPSTINSAANSTPLPILGNIHLPLHPNTGPPNNPVSFDMAGLHVQTEVGFQCPYELPFSVVGGNIVLAGNRLTYTQSEITQMASYLDSHVNSGASPPPTLRWVGGGSVIPIPGKYDSGTVPCGGEIDVTNMGNTSIQIPQISMRLIDSPIQNSYHYRLVEICSILSSIGDENCPGGRGGWPQCDTYFASIKLGVDKTGSAFNTSMNNPRCGIPTLAPHGLITFVVSFTLSSGTPNNLIYSVSPELTIDTASGKKLLSLPQLASRLVFASPQQFSCYELQGTTFALIPSAKYNSGGLLCL